MRFSIDLSTVAGALMAEFAMISRPTHLDFGIAPHVHRIPAKASRHPGAVAHRKWKTRRASGKR